MTNENIIEIKKQQKGWFAKGLFYLVLMVGSLYVSLSPMISSFALINSGIFRVAGISLFAIFTFMYIFNIYKACKPDNAIILSAHGFIDRINIGDNVEIEWTNVCAVKMLGRSNMPYLGITLENTDFVISKVKKKAAREICENVEQNLPTILIPQSKVKMPIKDLKDIFAKFAREARAIEKEAQQRTKSNPFTTDDVLRAFGKLPKEETKEEPEQLSDIPPDVSHSNTIDDSIPEENIDINLNDQDSEDDDNNTLTREFSSAPIFAPASPFEVPNDIPSHTGVTKSASDSFYEALRSKAYAKNTSQAYDNQKTSESYKDICNEEYQDNDINCENLPDEVKDILNRPMSSKITEIEEMLLTNDIPYSLSREDDTDGVEASNEAETFEEAVLADESKACEECSDNLEIESSEPLSNDVVNDNDVASDESNDDGNDSEDEDSDINTPSSQPIYYEEDDEDDISVSELDTMIKEALANSKKSKKTITPPNDENLGDTKEFILK